MTRVPPSDFAPGTSVGDYRIEHVIGVGGMGTVYRALHRVIEKRVALKVLHRELCGNDEMLGRFVREARSVNRIRHPNIVDVFGFGSTDDGRAYLAMELLEGESLADCIDVRCRSGVGLPLAEACHILTEIAHALEAAHQAGVVHRDLKPDNVFLLADRSVGAVKLLDFGIAKLLEGEGVIGAIPVEHTQPGILIGTPRYIAPEQARLQSIDGRADIYALGVLAFELFAGRLPFIGSDGVDLVAKHVALAPPNPSDFDPLLPALVDELVGSMLAKAPGERPTLPQVRERLARIPNEPPGENPQHRMRLDETKVGLPAVQPRRRRSWGALVVLSIVVLGGAGWLARTARKEPIAKLPAPVLQNAPPASSPAQPTAPTAPTAPTELHDLPEVVAPVLIETPRPSKATTTRKPIRDRGRVQREPAPRSRPVPVDNEQKPQLVPADNAQKPRPVPVDDNALRDPFEPTK